MEAPRCRLCGERHYGLCDFGNAERSPTSEGRRENAPRKALQERPAAAPKSECGRTDSGMPNEAGVASGPLTSSGPDVPPDITPEDAERILSESEQLERLREAGRERKRRWYERLKSDPVRYAAYLERERERKKR